MTKPAAPQYSILDFFNACHYAWGPSFAAPLAEALSRESGRRVSAPQVHSWAKLHRPIPLWVADFIVPVLERRAFDLQQQARAAYEETQKLKRDLYPPLPSLQRAPLPIFTPAVDDDGPAPRS
jgi:hypothetical protein